MSDAAVVYIVKLISVVFIGISIYFATMIVSQNYIDKVFVYRENPPFLSHHTMYTMIIHMVFMSVLFAIMYLIFHFNDGNLSGQNLLTKGNILSALYDYLFVLVLVYSVLYVIGGVMQNKKYFGYKDNGLRAIRALADISLYIYIIIAAIPFVLVVKNIAPFLTPHTDL